MTTIRAESLGTHMIVLPGGGYAAHTPHEAEPVARWLGGIGVSASVFRYPLNVRHPVPLDALRAEIGRRRAAGAQRVGLIGFSAGGHLAGLAALAPGATPDQAVQFAVLGYAITSMETETYRPARLILLGEDASPELRRSVQNVEWCACPRRQSGRVRRVRLALRWQGPGLEYTAGAWLVRLSEWAQCGPGRRRVATWPGWCAGGSCDGRRAGRAWGGVGGPEGPRGRWLEADRRGAGRAAPGGGAGGPG